MLGAAGWGSRARGPAASELHQAGGPQDPVGFTGLELVAGLAEGPRWLWHWCRLVCRWGSGALGSFPPPETGRGPGGISASFNRVQAD
jgi:hypothetical protein